MPAVCSLQIAIVAFSVLVTGQPACTSTSTCLCNTRGVQRPYQISDPTRYFAASLRARVGPAVPVLQSAVANSYLLCRPHGTTEKAMGTWGGEKMPRGHEA
jgi:hypothetical protein